ncbi:MAG: polyprenyl diphosphate synthase [Elusimicrobiota bacterium]
MTIGTTKNIPDHVGIIMDGNSRWAKMRGLSVDKGHQQGAKAVKGIVKQAVKAGIDYLSLYAFSTENWERPTEEIQTLMDLFVIFINSEVDSLMENNVKLLFAGRRDKFSDRVKKTMDDGVERTAQNTGLNLIICVDYGGRREIIDGLKKMEDKSQNSGGISSEKLKKNLYLPEVPDMDLMIRTSGEKRISNFMLWRIAYAELYFTPVLWPDFSNEEFNKAIRIYRRRNRRFGKRV